MLERLSGETRLFPIIGDPIRAVQSPGQLTRGFDRRERNAACIPMQVPAEAFDAVMEVLSRTPNVVGLLVTMPHKATAFERCATSSERAERSGVVSVIRRNEDGTWHGDMLDGLAFLKAQTDAGAEPEGANALLIGAGSAGSAIALALLDAGVRKLAVSDTDASKAGKLVELLKESRPDARIRASSADQMGFDMVCNASPAGMQEGDALPVPEGSLAFFMFVGDVVAGHGETPLLKAARDAGCRTADGVQMVEAVQEMILEFMLDV